MGQHFRWASFVALVLAGMSVAQGPAKKEASRPIQAEVRFADGSLVRMHLVQENLEVMTKYGKLTVPVRDIRRIDFGIHLPPGVDAQVEQAIKQMGSDVYKQREDAARELVSLGPMAFPMVQKAARDPDLEVAQRATSVLKRISEKTPADQLRTKMEDTIHTVDFPIIGRLVSSTIKANSPHFGELTLKLSDLRTLHIRSSPTDSEITVDATKYGSQPDQWLDSGLVIDSGLRLVILGEGQVDLWPQGPGQYMTGPKGYTTPGKGSAFMAGSLLGRIGENGKTFYVGERFEGIANEEGKLFFHIVPSPWNNTSSGSFRVKVTTDHVALSGR